MSRPRVAVVVTAGGSGRRLGAGLPKQFLEVAGRPVLARALEGALRWAASASVELVRVAVSHPEGGGPQTSRILEEELVRQGFSFDIGLIVPGGATRQQSVLAALRALPEGLEAVFVHDGARPLADEGLYAELWRALDAYPEAAGAVPLLPPADTLKQVAPSSAGGLRLAGTLDRQAARAVQTPQLFGWPALLAWHEAAAERGLDGPDDAWLAEALGVEAPVLVVDGRRRNVKVTLEEDLAMVEGMLHEPGPPGSSLAVPRIGQGFDVHAFAEGRPLILGGVAIPHDKGLAGHSDADVLLHAITDALLGAAGLDDIGAHFPDTDERWRGADSWELLREAARCARSAGWRPANVDATLIGERPKIRPHVPAMRARIAQALELPESMVNVKGTTTERLGFTGRGEGLAAQAVCLCLPVEKV